MALNEINGFSGLEELLEAGFSLLSTGLKGLAVKRLSEGEAPETRSHYVDAFAAESRAFSERVLTTAPESLGAWPRLLAEESSPWNTTGAILLSVAAVALDPECAALSDAAAGVPCNGAIPVDALEDLWCGSVGERMALRSSLSPSGSLVVSGICRVEYGISGVLMASLDSRGREQLLGKSSEKPAVAVPQAEPSKRSFSDLVLAPSVLEQVEEVIAAARGRGKALSEWGFGEQFERGLAISALFDGEPGTGKTLSAEVLSGELGLPLQRVNVAQILDKYVGGTQKNLEKVFFDASQRECVLLFDEADALFAKRMNVESSQDRFANLEINLLLQLMEGFRGVVVLTTNLRHGIDQAFERRIGYKVHFPFPDSSLRSTLWKNLIPAQTPLEPDVDFTELSERYELSGGSIKNALLRAAYGAAAANASLNMERLCSAAEKECAASGKLVRSSAYESSSFVV